MKILKKAHETVMERLEKENVIFVAPTGYGKSKAVPFIQSALGYPRSVHSMPLRSLVQAQLSFLLGNGMNACHASGLSLPGKCPYMGGKRVVSTVDYLSLVLLRLPPPELGWVLKYSLGHYEYPRANVLNSLVVLDEAHLLAEPWEREPGRGRDFLYASLETLSSFGTRTLVTTATLPEKELKGMKRKLDASVVAVCKSCYGNSNVVRVKDDLPEIKWRTEVFQRELEDFVKEKRKEIEDEASKGKVLIVANTVPEAVAVAAELRDLEPALVHGRLSENDKKEAVEKINNAKVVVSTQVIEAGVDVDATWLITESAPVSSLAQRAGRLCRARQCDEARVTVLPGDVPYGEAAERAFEEIKRVADKEGIEWRLLDDTNSGKTFLKLIDLLESNYKVFKLKSTYAHIISTPLPDIKNIKGLLNNLCSFVRDSALIEVRAGEERVEASLDWLKGNYKKLKIKDVVAVGYGEERSLGRNKAEKLLQGCKGYSELLEETGASSIALVLEEDQYSKGWGLLAQNYLGGKS